MRSARKPLPIDPDADQPRKRPRRESVSTPRLIRLGLAKSKRSAKDEPETPEMPEGGGTQ
jgi:hypothetical protein